MSWKLYPVYTCDSCGKKVAAAEYVNDGGYNARSTACPPKGWIGSGIYDKSYCPSCSKKLGGSK